ncbi:hypothetical protein [Pseudidiomarina mangrovi]|uniref:hypothetical protein n=1 Tax=Pseudidiomarina mangrovi TaxID=2487133 RepID=UPI000FCA9103|nr:hypothetical protein [Pseudidiomarina mangrovi]
MISTYVMPEARNVFNIQEQERGRAGVPFLNWRFATKKFITSEQTNKFLKGPGLYALWLDDTTIYVGSYLGRGKNGAYFNGNVVKDRIWTHFGAITMRGHRVHIARKSLNELQHEFGEAHDMVAGLLRSPQRDVLHKDNGNLAPLRRAQFAAKHWDSFSTSSPDDLLQRIGFAYTRFSELPEGMTNQQLKQRILEEEKRLIECIAPICNTTHARLGQNPIIIDGHDMARELSDIVAAIAGLPEL